MYFGGNRRWVPLFSMAGEKRRIVTLEEDNQLTHKICAMFTREFF